MTSVQLTAARRARARADEARAALDAIERRFEAAQEGCYPGPRPQDVERARAAWEAAEADAEAALKLAAPDRVRDLTAKIDALTSRGVLSIADVEVVARELGVAAADRCASDILDRGDDLDEAATRAAWALEEPLGLILAEFRDGPAEQARQRLQRAAVDAFKARIAELRRH